MKTIIKENKQHIQIYLAQLHFCITLVENKSEKESPDLNFSTKNN